MNKIKFLIQKMFLGFRLLKKKTIDKYPLHLSIEVTKRCNAKCKFCNYYKENIPETIIDYSWIVKKIKPLVISITGGEPLVRVELEDIIQSIRSVDKYVYINMISNGAAMTYERALNLFNLGLNGLSFSLDYIGEKHDENRGVPDLFTRLVNLIPKLKTIGFDQLGFNTVIMNDNLDHIASIIDLAKDLGINVNFSSYSDLKTNDKTMLVTGDNLNKLEGVIKHILEYKKNDKAKTIKSSNYYIENVLNFFKGSKIKGCMAGLSWILLTPDGKVKRCSEEQALCSIEDYSLDTFKSTNCVDCWFSCRGEAQCPFSFNRLRDLI